MSLTLREVIEASVARAKRWHPGFPDDDTWTGSDWSNAMCGEAGETANVVKKLRRHQTGLNSAYDPAEPLLRAHLGEEIADTILYAVLLSAKYDIDLEGALIAKFNKVSDLQGFPERLEDERWAEAADFTAAVGLPISVHDGDGP